MPVCFLSGVASDDGEKKGEEDDEALAPRELRGKKGDDTPRWCVFVEERGGDPAD